MVHHYSTILEVMKNFEYRQPVSCIRVGEDFFVFTKKNTAIQCKLCDYDCSRLGFAYFNLEINADLVLTFDAIANEKRNMPVAFCILLPKLGCSGILSSNQMNIADEQSSYTAITSEWLCLNESGSFNIPPAAKSSYKESMMND
jgi:hypothetical protein